MKRIISYVLIFLLTFSMFNFNVIILADDLDTDALQLFLNKLATTSDVKRELVAVVLDEYIKDGDNGIDELKNALDLLITDEQEKSLNKYGYTINDVKNELDRLKKWSMEDRQKLVGYIMDGAVSQIEDLILSYEEVKKESNQHTSNSSNSSNTSHSSHSQPVIVKEINQKEPKITVLEMENSIELLLDENSIELKETLESIVVEVSNKAITKAIELAEDSTEEIEELKNNTKLILETKNKTKKEVVANILTNDIKRLAENKIDLVVKSNDIKLTIPSDAIYLNEKDITEGTKFSLKIKELDNTEISEIKDKIEFKNKHIKNKDVLKVIDFSAEILNDNEKRQIESFNKPLVITLDLTGVDPLEYDKIGVYYIDEDNKPEFIGSKIKDGYIQFEINHFSKYALIKVDVEFNDLEKHWAKNYIESMASKQIVDGYPNGDFRPNDSITRAQFIKLIIKVLGLDLIEYSGEFNDVSKNKWYADYVATAKKAGFVEGYEDGTFKPDKQISRLEMAVLLSRVVKDVSLNEGETKVILEKFKDNEYIHNWGRDDVAKVVKIGLMVGLEPDKFVPNATTTRAEAATVMYRLFNR